MNVIDLRKYRIVKLLNQSFPRHEAKGLLHYEEAYDFLHEGLAALCINNVVQAWKMLENFLTFLNSLPTVKKWDDITEEMYITYVDESFEPLKTFDFIYSFYRFVISRDGKNLPVPFIKVYRRLKSGERLPARTAQPSTGKKPR